MKAVITVDLDLVVETVWPPIGGKKDNTYGLAVIVELQATAADGVHDTRIVDAFDRYPQLFCT